MAAWGAPGGVGRRDARCADDEVDTVRGVLAERRVALSAGVFRAVGTSQAMMSWEAAMMMARVLKKT